MALWKWITDLPIAGGPVVQRPINEAGCSVELEKEYPKRYYELTVA
jgi:hypothetical protein